MSETALETYEFRPVPGVYGWTDDSRRRFVIKLGCGEDVQKRTFDETKETGSTGVLTILFVLECKPGEYRQFEKIAKEWLKQNGCNLHYLNPLISKQKELYMCSGSDIDSLKKVCMNSSHFVKYYGPQDKLPMSKRMLPEIFRHPHHFRNFPEELLNAPIIVSGRDEYSRDSEYKIRKEYFQNNKLSLNKLFKINEKNRVVINPIHKFRYTKNNGKEVRYTLQDFKYDLEKRRLMIDF